MRDAQLMVSFNQFVTYVACKSCYAPGNLFLMPIYLGQRNSFSSLQMGCWSSLHCPVCGPVCGPIGAISMAARPVGISSDFHTAHILDSWHIQSRVLVEKVRRP